MRAISGEGFKVHAKLDENIGILTLTPSLSINVVESYTKLKGFVLQSFGAGNVPHRNEVTDIFKKATAENECIIVNCTQCKAGEVNQDYECGRQLVECGVICGHDMVN